LRPATPHCDNFLTTLEAASQENPKGSEVVNYMANACFPGKLLYMNEVGEPIEKPVPMPVKMEELLRTALGRRTKYTRAKQDFTTDSIAKFA